MAKMRFILTRPINSSLSEGCKLTNVAAAVKHCPIDTVPLMASKE